MQNMAQFDYNDAIAARCDDPPLPNWREAMYRASGERLASSQHNMHTCKHKTILDVASCT